MSHIRAQKKNQNARQAMVISGLSTIYRNTTTSHAIKTQRHTEPRIYFLNISTDDINKSYAKIRQITEKGSAVTATGISQYQVKTKTEHLLITETHIYEIGLLNQTDKRRERGGGGGGGGGGRDREQHLHLRVPVDGNVTIKEINVKVSGDSGSHGPRDYNIPVLIDESYYELHNTRDMPVPVPVPVPVPAATTAVHLSPNHIYVIQVKKTIKFHAKSPNAFVFVFDGDGYNDDDKTKHPNVIDFYMTTEDEIIQQGDKLNNTFKEDMISFLLQFKLCS